MALLSFASYVTQNNKGKEKDKCKDSIMQYNGCEIISYCPVALLNILTLICLTNTNTNINANEKNENASADNYRVEREWNLKC